MSEDFDLDHRVGAWFREIWGIITNHVIIPFTKLGR